jgi:hypothetical protein
MGEINLLVDNFSHDLDTVTLNVLSLNIGKNKTYKVNIYLILPY